MIHTIRLYIEKYRLLSEDRPVLVGLSGGADSVALLGVLVRLGYPCIALHCNFHLRGEESDRDEAFACEFAESLEVPFHKIDFDTISYAGESTSSANRRKECWMSVRSLKKSRWSSSTFKITATVGKKLRKLLQYSQDSRMMVSPWPTR